MAEQQETVTKVEDEGQDFDKVRKSEQEQGETFNKVKKKKSNV